MTRFDKYLASILARGADEARKDGSGSVEAQHLLLAIAADAEPSTRDILGPAGLGYGALREALDREFERSLSAAGVSLASFDLPRERGVGAGREPQPGESVRLALERGIGPAGRDVRPAHLLLGILRARVGTVPRALAFAGVDQDTLVSRVEQALGA